MQYINSIGHFKLRKPNTQLKRYFTFHVKYHLDWLLFVNLGLVNLRFIILKHKANHYSLMWGLVFFPLCLGKCQNNAIEGICKKSYFFFALLQTSDWFLQFQISLFLQMHSISDLHSHFQLYTVTIVTFVMITIIL